MIFDEIFKWIRCYHSVSCNKLINNVFLLSANFANEFGNRLSSQFLHRFEIGIRIETSETFNSVIKQIQILKSI